MRGIDSHPQKKEIIDAILAGESLRSIAKRVVPPTNHSILSRFKCSLLTPAIRSLRGNGEQVQQTKRIAASNGIPISPEALRTIDANQANHQGLKGLLEARIDKRLSRREKWIEAAESHKVIDKDGEVYESMDHRALAAHDRNEGSDIETLAKLGGLLQQAAPVSQVLQVVVSMPAPVANGPSDCITLDVLPER